MISFTLPGKSIFSPPKPKPVYIPPPTPRTAKPAATAKTPKVPKKAAAPEVKEAAKKQRKDDTSRQGFSGNIRTSARGARDEAETKRKKLLGQ
jgi:hypothetical protein